MKNLIYYMLLFKNEQNEKISLQFKYRTFIFSLIYFLNNLKITTFFYCVMRFLLNLITFGGNYQAVNSIINNVKQFNLLY